MKLASLTQSTMQQDVLLVNLPRPGEIVQLEIANEDEVEYYASVMKFQSLPQVIKFPFLVTESMLKSVEDNKSVVMLFGAKGTGKSTTCLFCYHWAQIQNPSQAAPFLAVSAESLTSIKIAMLKKYLECFQQHLTESVALDPNDSYGMIMSVLRALRKQEVAYVFVDVGSVGKDATALHKLSDLIIIAHLNRWKVIVASSSGGNFLMSTSIDQDFKRAKKSFTHATQNAVWVEVKDFNDHEADLYVEFNNVVSSKRYLRNPLLLSCYRNVSRVDEKLVENIGDWHVQNLMMQIVNEAIDVLKKNDCVLSTLENSLPFLARAQKGDVLANEEEYRQFRLSYIGLEYLAVTQEADEGHQLKAHFPDLFPLFVRHIAERLKNEHPDRLSMLLQDSHVKGALFEIQLLRQLKNINVSATNCDDPLQTFKFKVRGALYQESRALKAPIIGQIFHLRSSHPAIVAVCYALEVDTKELYLLLIQVSISEYKNHAAKAIDITERVPNMEGGSSDTSLAEYYVKLHDEAILTEDHVIYVYISPTDLYHDTINLKEEYFGSETQSRSHPSGRNPAKYWYGLITKSSGSANEVLTIYENAKLGR